MPPNEQATRWHTMPSKSILYTQLDPGIRELVRWLVEYNGCDTTDSGDGEYKGKHGWEPGSYLTVPHVFIQCDSAVHAENLVNRLYTQLVSGNYDHSVHEMPEGKCIQATYGPGGPWLVSVLGFTNVDVPVKVLR